MKRKVMSAQDLENIHEATLKVMAKTGVSFKDSPKAQEIFKAAGCKIENERVYFPREVITEGLTRVPDRNSIDHYNRGLGFTRPVSLKQGDVSFGLIGCDRA